MKKTLLALVQILLFFALFAVFSFLQPFGLHWMVSHPAPTITRYFVADGFLLATAALALILVGELLTRSLRSAGLVSFLSYVAAVVLGFAVRLGFVTHDLLS